MFEPIKCSFILLLVPLLVFRREYDLKGWLTDSNIESILKVDTETYVKI